MSSPFTHPTYGQRVTRYNNPPSALSLSLLKVQRFKVQQFKVQQFKVQRLQFLPPIQLLLRRLLDFRL